MSRISVIFLLLSINLLGNYRIKEGSKYKILVHESITSIPESINDDFISKALEQVNQFFGSNELNEKMNIYIIQAVNHDNKGNSLIINLNEEYIRSKRFDIHDKNFVKFFFYYELSRFYIDKKIKNSYPLPIKILDYLNPIEKVIKESLFPEWLSEGLSLYLAFKFGNAKLNNDLIKKYSKDITKALDNSFIKGEEVRYKVKPYELFYYLDKDDFTIPYLVFSFIEFYNINFKDLTIKLNNMFENSNKKDSFQNPFLTFSNKNLNNLMNLWWNSLEKEKDLLYSDITKDNLRKIEYNNNKIYFLSTLKNKTSIKYFNVLNNKYQSIYENELLSNYSIHKDDIFLNKTYNDSSSDFYKISLYKWKPSNYKEELINDNLIGNSLVTDKGIFLIKREGLKNRLFLDDKEIILNNHDVTIQSLHLNGNFLYLALSNDSKCKIYKLNLNNLKLEYICDGKSPIIHKNDLYFLDYFEDKISLFKLFKNKKYYIPNNFEILEIVSSGEMYALTYFKGEKSIKKLDLSNLKIYPYKNDVIDFKKNELVKEKLKSYSFSNYKFYPSLDINVPFNKSSSAKINYEYSKGLITRERIFKFSLGVPIKDVLNLRISSLISKTIHLNGICFIPSLEFNKDIFNKDLKYNNLKLRFCFGKDYNSLAIYGKLGFYSKYGAGLEVDTKHINLRYYLGNIGSSYEAIKGINLIDGEKQNFLCLNRKSFLNIPINLSLINYKLKLKEISLENDLYIVGNFITKKIEKIINPGIKMNFNIFYKEASISYSRLIKLDFKNIKESFKNSISYIGLKIGV